MHPSLRARKKKRGGDRHTGRAPVPDGGTRRTKQWPENSASSCDREEPLDAPTRGSHKNTLFSAQPKAPAAAPTNQQEKMTDWQGRRKATPAPRYLIRAATLMLGSVRVRAAGGGGSWGVAVVAVAVAVAVAAAAARRDARRGLARVFASPPVSGPARRPLGLPAGRLAGGDAPYRRLVPVTGTSWPRKNCYLGMA